MPASLPRVDFFHWVLIDLPPDTPPIARGEFSDGVTARGKPGPHAPRGARQGINDYTGWFAGDKDMAGNYFGYDGPCPPWNDAIPHRYVFTLYALDVARLAVAGIFTRRRRAHGDGRPRARAGGGHRALHAQSGGEAVAVRRLTPQGRATPLRRARVASSTVACEREPARVERRGLKREDQRRRARRGGTHAQSPFRQGARRARSLPIESDRRAHTVDRDQRCRRQQAPRARPGRRE